MTAEDFRTKWPVYPIPFGDDLGYYAWCAMYKMDIGLKYLLLTDLATVPGWGVPYGRVMDLACQASVIGFRIEGETEGSDEV